MSSGERDALQELVNCTDEDVEEVISAVTAPVAKFGSCEVGVRFVLNEIIGREVEKAVQVIRTAERQAKVPMELTREPPNG